MREPIRARIKRRMTLAKTGTSKTAAKKAPAKKAVAAKKPAARSPQEEVTRTFFCVRASAAAAAT